MPEDPGSAAELAELIERQIREALEAETQKKEDN